MSDIVPEQENSSLVPSKKRPSSTVDEIANKRSASQITMEPGKVINLSRSSSIPSDVEINVLGDVYHLHSSILCNASKFFDCSLSKIWYKPGNAHAGEDGIKFRYSLVLAAEDEYVGCFEPIPPSTQRAPDSEEPVNSSPESSPPPGGPEDDSPGTSPDAPGLEEEIKLIYAAIFGTFYHHSFGSCFDEDEQALTTTTRIMRIIETAEFLSCLETIRDSVELFLLRWCWRPVRERTHYNKPKTATSRGFKLTTIQELRISNRIQDLLPIAIKLRSKELYPDCFVHFVGMLQFGEDMLVDGQYQVMDQLVDELEDVLFRLPTSTAKTIMRERRELQKPVNGAFNCLLEVFTDDGGWRHGTDRFNKFMLHPAHSSTEKFRQLLADRDDGDCYLFDPEMIPAAESEYLVDTFRDLSISRLEHAESHVYRHFVCANAPKEFPWDVSAE